MKTMILAAVILAAVVALSLGGAANAAGGPLLRPSCCRHA
jgi:hypothetical protein